MKIGQIKKGIFFVMAVLPFTQMALANNGNDASSSHLQLETTTLTLNHTAKLFINSLQRADPQLGSIIANLSNLGDCENLDHCLNRLPGPTAKPDQQIANAKMKNLIAKLHGLYKCTENMGDCQNIENPNETFGNELIEALNNQNNALIELNSNLKDLKTADEIENLLYELSFASIGTYLGSSYGEKYLLQEMTKLNSDLTAISKLIPAGPAVGGIEIVKTLLGDGKSTVLKIARKAKNGSKPLAVLSLIGGLTISLGAEKAFDHSLEEQIELTEGDINYLKQLITAYSTLSSLLSRQIMNYQQTLTIQKELKSPGRRPNR